MRHFRPMIASVLMLVSACCACSPSPKAPASQASPPMQSGNFIADLQDKTVALVEPIPSDGILPAENHVYCSGVWIDQNTIVTANHCVEDLELGANVFYATKADVSETDDNVIRSMHMSDLLAQDPDHDLALIRVSLPPTHGVASLAQNVAVGERDASMGHPMDMLWSYSEGLVSAIRTTGDLELPMTWVQSTAPISPGNSGGGLFNEQGELLGICSRGITGRAQNLNFYVHVQYVKNLMRIEQVQ